jgi:hypothetical protein
VEAFFDRVAEKIRPAKGQAWDSLEHRHADTMIGLCRLETPADGSGTGRYDEDRAQAPTMAVRPMIVVGVPLHGPALLCGIPTPAPAPGASPPTIELGRDRRHREPRRGLSVASRLAGPSRRARARRKPEPARRTHAAAHHPRGRQATTTRAVRGMRRGRRTGTRIGTSA